MFIMYQHFCLLRTTYTHTHRHTHTHTHTQTHTHTHTHTNTHTHTHTHLTRNYICSHIYVAAYVWLSHRSGRWPKTYVKPEAAITVFELLMMDDVSPETCWAIKKHWNNKFCLTVASCWFFLWVLSLLNIHTSLRLHFNVLIRFRNSNYIFSIRYKLTATQKLHGMESFTFHKYLWFYVPAVVKMRFSPV